MKYVLIYTLFGMLVFHTSCGQNQTNPSQDNFSKEHNGISESQLKELATSKVPMGQVRNIKQNRIGNILIAAAWGVVFRYDGKSFTNLTSSKIGLHRFWDVLEDRRGNLWFATTDSGVYNYNGKSFQHFTTREGLAKQISFVLVLCVVILSCHKKVDNPAPILNFNQTTLSLPPIPGASADLIVESNIDWQVSLSSGATGCSLIKHRVMQMIPFILR